jgi:hypothetical protein
LTHRHSTTEVEHSTAVTPIQDWDISDVPDATEADRLSGALLMNWSSNS